MVFLMAGIGWMKVMRSTTLTVIFLDFFISQWNWSDRFSIRWSI
jgi:hypothetical protein